MLKKINDWELNLDDQLVRKINLAYQQKNIAPKKNNIFKIYEKLKLKDIKVVILGQDPYPKKGDATGYAFSVERNYNLPASLKNIFKELETDLKIKRKNGDLTDWIKQGVFLLNTVLTVEIGNPKSHNKLGWQDLTLQTIKQINEQGKIIFVFLGKDAQQYEKYITNSTNKIIKTSHPSPLAAYRGFFGSKLFTKINKNLRELKKEEIKWN